MLNSIKRFLLDHNYITLLIGWLFGCLILCLFRDIKVGPLAFLPGYFMLVIYVFDLSKKLLRNKTNVLFTYFITGVTTNSITYWIFRDGTGSQYSYDTIDPLYYLVFNVLLIMMFLLVSYLSKLIKLKETEEKINMKSNTIILFVVIILSIGFYRLHYLLNMDIPNEDRSLFICGSEIHHLILGSLLLLLFGIILENKLFLRYKFTYIIFGIIIGMIFDEITFMLLYDLSDKAYGEMFSWSGAILFPVLLLIYTLRKFNKFDKS